MRRLLPWGQIGATTGEECVGGAGLCLQSRTVFPSHSITEVTAVLDLWLYACLGIWALDNTELLFYYL